jgi:hypothetical protein
VTASKKGPHRQSSLAFGSQPAVTALSFQQSCCMDVSGFVSRACACVGWETYWTRPYTRHGNCCFLAMSNRNRRNRWSHGSHRSRGSRRIRHMHWHMRWRCWSHTGARGCDSEESEQQRPHCQICFQGNECIGEARCEVLSLGGDSLDDRAPNA